jgi:phage shock protein PspC (stress-responsive transcriptional regulator)
MVPQQAPDEADAMTTTPPPPPPPPAGAPSDAADAPRDASDPAGGPRVSGPEMRNLAALRRSRSDKKVAGVAGGISRHLDIDPLITRVVLVVLFFFGGAGLIVYVACWLVVPLDGEETATIRLDDRSRNVALTIVGGLAALALLGDSLGGWGFPWPLAVLGAIVLVVMFSRGRFAAPATTGPSTAPSPGPSTGPSVGTSTAPGAPTAWQPVAQPVAEPVEGTPAKERRAGPRLFSYAVAIIAIGIGILASLDLAGVPVADSAYPALALVASGVMLTVGAFWGRPGGLIALGLVSALATAATLAVGDLDAGQIDRSPSTSSGVASDYDLDIGEIKLDLTGVVDASELDGRTVELDVGLGRIEVTVPDDIDVIVRSDLGAGDSTIFGDESSGGTDTVTSSARTGAADVPTLTLDVHVDLGEIQINREGGN